MNFRNFCLRNAFNLFVLIDLLLTVSAENSPLAKTSAILSLCNGQESCNFSLNDMVELKCKANFSKDSLVNLTFTRDHNNEVTRTAFGKGYALVTEHLTWRDDSSKLQCQMNEKKGQYVVSEISVAISYPPTTENQSSDGQTINANSSFDVANSKQSFTINIFANPEPLYVNLYLNGSLVESTYTIKRVDNDVRKNFIIRVTFLNETTSLSNAIYEMNISNDRYSSNFHIKLESQKINATAMDWWLWMNGIVARANELLPFVGLVILMLYWKYYGRPKLVENEATARYSSSEAKSENTSLAITEHYQNYNVIDAA